MDSNLKCAEITEQTAQQLRAMSQYKHSLITRTDRCSKRAEGKECEVMVQTMCRNNGLTTFTKRTHTLGLNSIIFYD